MRNEVEARDQCAVCGTLMKVMGTAAHNIRWCPKCRPAFAAEMPLSPMPTEDLAMLVKAVERLTAEAATLRERVARLERGTADRRRL